MHDIVINYGSDIMKTAYDALVALDATFLFSKDTKVAIKPNLVLARPADSGATTHPEVIAAIIIYLKELGVENIKIIESAWVGDRTERAFDVCGYRALSKKYGVPLVDLKKDSSTAFAVSGLAINVCDEALKCDVLINVPVLKAHCQTELTCCMKNLKGCIPDEEKRRFHTLGLHKPIAYLNTILKCQLSVIDGICGDMTFEEGGNPVERNMILAGFDPLLLDSYCGKLLGCEPEEIGYIRLAKKLGIGKIIDDQARILEMNVDNKPKLKQLKSNVAKKLSGYIDEKDACSACYSSLIMALHKLDEPTKRKLKGKIHIGQGFKGKEMDGIGVGVCTKGCRGHVVGCPPTAADIMSGLKGLVMG